MCWTNERRSFLRFWDNSSSAANAEIPREKTFKTIVSNFSFVSFLTKDRISKWKFFFIFNSSSIIDWNRMSYLWVHCHRFVYFMRKTKNKSSLIRPFIRITNGFKWLKNDALDAKTFVQNRVDKQNSLIKLDGQPQFVEGHFHWGEKYSKLSHKVDREKTKYVKHDSMSCKEMFVTRYDSHWSENYHWLEKPEVHVNSTDNSKSKVPEYGSTADRWKMSQFLILFFQTC